MKKQGAGHFSIGGGQFSIIVFWPPGHFSTQVNILSDTGIIHYMIDCYIFSLNILFAYVLCTIPKINIHSIFILCYMTSLYCTVASFYCTTPI